MSYVLRHVARTLFERKQINISDTIYQDANSQPVPSQAHALGDSHFLISHTDAASNLLVYRYPKTFDFTER